MCQDTFQLLLNVYLSGMKIFLFQGKKENKLNNIYEALTVSINTYKTTKTCLVNMHALLCLIVFPGYHYLDSASLTI